MNITKEHRFRVKKPNLFNNIGQWFKKHRLISWIICIIFVLCIAGATTYYILAKKSTNSSKTGSKQTTKVAPEPIKYYSKLTGLQVTDEATTNLPVVGVMIPNDTYGARPQSGLKNSGVVFEAICEGGISRFLVLFQEQKLPKIGPIRSVRMYYLSWAAAFQAGVVHVGGNMDVLAEISNGSYRNFDEFAYGDYFWRDENYDAPNNMYTSSANLDAINALNGYTTSTFTSWPRVDGKSIETPDAVNINVIISDDSSFNSSYIYDPVNNYYIRYQGGEAHMDREDGQIAPNVVIAMHVDEYSSDYPENHEEITTIGSGNATIFQNGTAIAATWSKASQFEQLLFTDAEGNNIPLVRGQTWIVAVPNEYGSVTYTGQATQ